jgi:5-methylcytosine-specific restriction endonuclease McrA
MNFKSGRWARKACRGCGSETDNQIYCSEACKRTHRTNLLFEKIDRGEYLVKPYGGNETLKKYLISRRGRQCEVCKNTKWQEQEIPLTSHHVDGNANNNLPTNLQLICPNCHALTPNYGKKNEGKSARTDRKHAGVV